MGIADKFQDKAEQLGQTKQSRQQPSGRQQQPAGKPQSSGRQQQPAGKPQSSGRQQQPAGKPQPTKGRRPQETNDEMRRAQRESEGKLRQDREI
ncbi:hypothetical protein GCM10020367_27310 [Streptomyces sannanensis]|uniref:Uncharacterized protein n=1 Tax=Streptomyces sannanensis TaxID=285536 RepID=A0ABP6SAX7_9ACTN